MKEIDYLDQLNPVTNEVPEDGKEDAELEALITTVSELAGCSGCKVERTFTHLIIDGEKIRLSKESIRKYLGI